ncbi:MAG TPA: quinone oxidoreductase [Motilibacteraceae bacterium]|nr:quinone oxidoreductase [Motilibacteraceae bacterium]
MTSVRAVLVESNGGPEVLAVRDVEAPTPGTGQLLVQVAAAGVNYMDTYQREGVYQVPTPFVLGSEGAGRVLAVGEGVQDVAVGDRVAWSQAQGSYAEQVLVPAEKAVPVPDGVGDDVAAAVLLQGLTAHYLVTSTYAMSEGDPVLVHAAAGGVGLLLVQLAKARGARVLATVGSEEKAVLAREAGADEVLGYDGFAGRVRELTGGQGVAVVYDGVGRDTFDGSLAALRRRGLLVLFGAASGQVPPLELQRLNTGGSLFVTRPTLGDYVATREELLWRAGELFGAVASGQLDVRIGGRYPLAEAARAHRDLEGRRTTGKLLLTP